MSSDNNNRKKTIADLSQEEQIDALLNIGGSGAAPASAAAAGAKGLDSEMMAQLKANIAHIAKLEAEVEAAKQEKAERERKEKEAREKQAEIEREKDKANAEQNFDRNQAVLRIQEKLAAMDGRTLTPAYKEMQMALLSSRKDIDQEYQKQAVTAARNMRAQEKAIAQRDKDIAKLSTEVKQLRELLTLEDTLEQVGNAGKEGRAVKAARTNKAGARADRMMDTDPNNGAGVHPWAESIISQNFGASHGELIAINRGLMAQKDAAEERRKVSAARKTAKKTTPASATSKKSLVAAAAAKKKRAAFRDVPEEPAMEQEEDSEDEFLEDRVATMGRRDAGFYPSYVGKPRNEQSMSHNPHTKEFYRHLKNVGNSTDFTTGAGILHAGVDFGGSSNYYY